MLTILFFSLNTGTYWQQTYIRTFFYKKRKKKPKKKNHFFFAIIFFLILSQGSSAPGLRWGVSVLVHRFTERASWIRSALM